MDIKTGHPITHCKVEFLLANQERLGYVTASDISVSDLSAMAQNHVRIWKIEFFILTYAKIYGYNIRTNCGKLMKPLHYI